MKDSSSRRNFLAAGLSLPAAASAMRPQAPPARPNRKPDLVATPGLRYRTLGKTGLKVTEVGFGCMITSDGSVIERAADMGITYFDTARGYSEGNNERMVGAALKNKRKDIVLSSKSHGRNKAGALKDLDTSLKELGTDHLDIWYLHALSSASQITDELLEAQAEAKKAGKIRFAGVSTHGGQADVIRGAIKTGKVDVVLVAYNFTVEKEIADAMAEAHKAGLGIVAMKVMAGGFRRNKPGTKAYDTLKKDGAMVSALKWVLNNPNVDTTIPSITDVDQLEDNIRAMGAKFSPADQQLLAQQMEMIKPLYCRMCGKCEGTCAQGLPVSDVLRILSYADGYGQFGLARQRYLELPEEHAAAKCSQCPHCTVECPYGVQVAQRVSRAQDLFAC